MIRNHNKLACLGILSILVAAGACVAPDADALGGESQHPLASIELADEGHLEFHEPVPGELVMLYTGRDTTYRGLFDDLQRGAVSHAGIYATLSGADAPSALVDAEARALAARAEAEASSTDVERARAFELPPAAGGAKSGVGTSSLTAAEFTADYCPGGWGYMYCWTSRTGSGSVTRSSWSMYTYLNAYNGSVLHELEYENIWNNWVTYVSQVVPQGFISYISRSGLITTRRTSISQASGNGYHVSIYGN